MIRTWRFARLARAEWLSLRRCRMVSVRTAAETGALIEMLERDFGCFRFICAKPAREMTGVETVTKIRASRSRSLVGDAGCFPSWPRSMPRAGLGTAVTADLSR